MAVLAITTASNTAVAAPSVWGCDLLQRPDNLQHCVEGKLNERIEQATKEMKRQLEDAKKTAGAGLSQVGNVELPFLDGLRKLGLDKLHACLLGASNKSRTQIGDAVAHMAKDPAGWVRATIDDAWSLVTSDVEALVGDDLARLRRGEPPPADTNAVIDAAWTKFERVGSHHEGVGCLVTYLRPQVPAMKAQAAIAVRAAQDKAKEIWETKILPVVYDAIASAVAAGISKVEGPTTPSLIKAVVAERLLDPASVQDTARKIEALALAPTDPAKLADVRAALDNHRAAMDPELALEITRVLGHAYLRNDEAPGGGWLIDKGLGAVATLKDLAADTAESVCGLVPEVGAVGCAFVTYAAETAIVHAVIPAAKMTAVKTLDLMLDTAIDQSRAALQGTRAVSALRDAKASLGPFAKIADGAAQRIISSFVEPYVVKTRTALDAYNHSVKALVAAAARR